MALFKKSNINQSILDHGNPWQISAAQCSKPSFERTRPARDWLLSQRLYLIGRKFKTSL